MRFDLVSWSRSRDGTHSCAVWWYELDFIFTKINGHHRPPRKVGKNPIAPCFHPRHSSRAGGNRGRSHTSRVSCAVQGFPRLHHRFGIRSYPKECPDDVLQIGFPLDPWPFFFRLFSPWWAACLPACMLLPSPPSTSCPNQQGFPWILGFWHSNPSRTERHVDFTCRRGQRQY